MHYTDEIEINVFDLLLTIMKKWKIIIATMIIFGVLGGLYIRIKPANNAELSLLENEKADVEAIIQMEEKYSEGKKAVNEIMEKSSVSDFSDDEYNYIKSVSEIYTISVNSKKLFSDNQKKYYDMLKSGNTVMVAEPKSYIKYVLVGVLAGAFFACAFIALNYCFSGKLRMEKDLSSYFGLFTLGRADSNEKSENCLESIVDNIKFAANSAGLEKIAISVSGEKCCEEFFGVLLEKLKEKNIEVLKVNSPITVSDLQVFNKEMGVVLIERIGFSRYEVIGDEVLVCKQYDFPILGSVVIR